ncbi:uncharacterized protein LOC128892273 [Hylaeus anthracinus]|uniref:uncharacterized protein LOC128880742 n=1 Tax=Hylaeus volcanicus TaxID=313075 RepID=UPI0023B84F69|nr:uncharacterized protein LOC128880742 [Hylaeus volcanicus]XP_054008549.1 uncharacterized protein LOC128892273 [Hylaeus anthracinus]
MAPGVAFTIGLILVVGHLHQGPGIHAKTFSFPEYPYKETTKNELLFRQYEQTCEESGACKMLPPQSTIAKTRCIRECVSPSCYKEIYLFDQLEEGEIDVRLNSFKGCFMQRNGRPRK